MRNKDTGEFELVVGDKQLLSGFFIGVLLLAVVFAMGYVLGQSSPKSAKVASEPAASNTVSDARPQPAAPPPPSPDTAAANPPAPATGTPEQPAAAPPAEAPPQPTTVPARDPSASAAPAATAAAATPDPANASYWQVTAARRDSADAVLQSLKDKGFPVITRPGPNNLTLVWVGPYFDKDSLTKAKKQLEDAGFSTYKKP
jgi:cell division septation protein DedD